MAQSGTATFASPDDYQTAIGAARVKLVVTAGGDFNGQLTWLNLGRFHLLSGRENLPCIRFFSLPQAKAVISFSTKASVTLTYGGVVLQLGDIVFNSRGERLHQRTNGEDQWSLLMLPPEQLAQCGMALTGQKIVSPSKQGLVLRPSERAATRLLRLHSRVCRLAEARHDLITNPEVARALEQELLYALVRCLMADEVEKSKRRGHHADIMVRFEDALAGHTDPHLSVPALCATIGVPERTLRACCSEFLGMSPTRYHLLRRLNLARSSLQRADPDKTSVAEIARNHHFLEPGRFAVAYRSVFGEMPSTTLRHSRIGTA
jgi:AraC-like DNA-binding protein